MPDEQFFDAANIISDFINLPASVQTDGEVERYPTLPDALSYLRERGLANATVTVHSPEGDKQFTSSQLTSLVDALPDPLSRGN